MKFFNLQVRFLPVAVVFMLGSSSLWGQNQKQVKQILSQSNLGALKILQNSSARKSLTSLALSEMAKKQNSVFSTQYGANFFQFKGMDSSGLPLYLTTDNADAGKITTTSKLHSTFGLLDLEGQGMTIHEWDGGGVVRVHSEIRGRVTQKDIPTRRIDAHATHVAGTLVASGLDEKAKGMAPKAKLNAYDWNEDEKEMVEAAQSGALVSNHSYGYTGGFAMTNLSGSNGWHWMGEDEDTEFRYYGKYTPFDREWDLISLNAPYYLPVKAAGNPRGGGPEPGGAHFVRVIDPATNQPKWITSNKVRQKNGGEFGFDTVNQGAVGKNILTIGAVQKLAHYQNPNDVKMATFSAFGPVDDGRIKPDISGVGVDIYSLGTTGQSAYAPMSGTSMATPNVAGSLLLLQEAYSKKNNGTLMKAPTLKALAIATAKEVGENIGPDYKSGWGLLDAFKAVSTIETHQFYSLIEEKKLKNQTQDSFKVKASGQEPLKVTIVWNDPAPTNDKMPTTELNVRTPVLVNDLDIRVSDGQETFLPWKLNPAIPNYHATRGDNQVDNVEQILIENPQAGGEYTITISHKGQLKKNKLSQNPNGELLVELEDANEQEYSLIVTGINNGVDTDLSLEKIKVEAELYEYNTQTPIAFEIGNKGWENISGGTLRYQLVNQKNNQTEHQGEISLPEIQKNTTHWARVNLDLSQSFVPYKIVAEVVHSSDNIKINNKAEEKIYGTISDLTPIDASYEYTFEENFEQKGWTYQDKNEDEIHWERRENEDLSRTGTALATNFPNNTKGVNDWLFSNPLKIKAGQKYRLSFFVRKFQDLAEYLSVFVGDKPLSSAMTQALKEEIEPTSNYEFKRHSFYFQFPEDKVIFIGFHHKNKDANAPSYAIGIDDVKIQTAQSKPEVDFSADKEISNTYEAVTFSGDILSEDNFTQEWSFSPNHIVYEGGTDKNSKNPKVRFTQEGTFSVTLKAKNSFGESEYTRENYIRIGNVEARADFSNTFTSIYESQSVELKNISAGNPAPSEFQWEITPSDGVEFSQGTTPNSKNPVVKFLKSGLYSVSLKAKSQSSENSLTKNNLIEVKPAYLPVRQLLSRIDNTTGRLTLSWQKPQKQAIYNEDLDGTEVSITGNNANGDEFVWHISDTGYNNTKALRSWSWMRKNLTVDDWAITTKIPAGADLLSFLARHGELERYDVYVVEATADGKIPSVEQLKQGKKVFTFEATEKQNEFKKREFNIKDYTQKDFHIAFHHRTLASDSGLALVIDNIEVKYSPYSELSNGVLAEKNPVENKKFDAQSWDKNQIILAKGVKESTIKNISEQKLEPFGVLNLPSLSGYEIQNKNGESLKKIQNPDEKTFVDRVTQNGKYNYEVYAVYADGQKSEKQSIEVEVKNISSNLKPENAVVAYPNPSNGIFVLEQNSQGNLQVQIFDFTGRMIYQNTQKGRRLEIDIRNFAKGAYILFTKDEKGEKQTLRILIK